MKKLFILFLIAQLLLQTACSAFVGSSTSMNITVSERDAQIYVNGAYRGIGMIQTSVPRDENISILVKKEGFYTTQREIRTKLSPAGIVDAIGGFFWLIPWIGLAFPGAWTPDQKNISILLDPK